MYISHLIRCLYCHSMHIEPFIMPFFVCLHQISERCTVSIDRPTIIRIKWSDRRLPCAFISTAFDATIADMNSIEFSIWPCFYITFLKWDVFAVFFYSVRSGYRSAYQFCILFFAVSLPYLHVSLFYSLFILTLSIFVCLSLLLFFNNIFIPWHCNNVWNVCSFANIMEFFFLQKGNAYKTSGVLKKKERKKNTVVMHFTVAYSV